MKFKLTVFVLILLALNTKITSQQRIACIGDFILENGDTIINCQIGYRTFGKITNQKNNIILIPLWFGGRSSNINNLLGEDKIIDTTKYFVIAVDPLGNGISSSPSNYTKDEFPIFNIRDMVHSQYDLLTKHLNIENVYAIFGGSMGGAQVFEWNVIYPSFAKKSITYVGTAKLTASDLLIWTSQLKIIEVGLKYSADSYLITEAVAAVNAVTIQTNKYRNEKISPENFNEFLDAYTRSFATNFNAKDWRSQILAIMQHNIYKPFGNDKVKASNRVSAKSLIMLSKQDQLVDPSSAEEFGELIGANIFYFDNNCGHLAPSCEMEKFKELIHNFLNENHE